MLNNDAAYGGPWIWSMEWLHQSLKLLRLQRERPNVMSE